MLTKAEEGCPQLPVRLHSVLLAGGRQRRCKQVLGEGTVEGAGAESLSGAT